MLHARKYSVSYIIAIFTIVLLSVFAFSCKMVGNLNKYKVVMISIDGLKGDYYQQPELDSYIPTLKALMKNGMYATGLIPVFPSVTYPNHTSLITGVKTGKHGIISNTKYTDQKGPSPAWYWESEYVKAPTLLDLTKKEGLTSVAVRWPVTLKNTTATWLVPEIFGMKGFYEGDDWDLTVQFTNPDLMKEILGNIVMQKSTNELETDNWVAQATAYLIKAKSPDLTVVHLANLDHVEHGAGPDTKEAYDALAAADSNVKTILESVDLASTCVFIVGDHGFYAVQQSINVNHLFLEKGWITLDKDGALADFQVIGHSSGGQAAIYIKDKTLQDEVLQVLKDHAVQGNYDVIGRAQLDKLGSYPDASFAITAHEGFAVSGSLTAPELLGKSSVLGQHGHLPTSHKMFSGLIGSGCNIKAGQVLKDVPNVDVAPTLAHILGFEMQNVDGHVISYDKN